MENKTSKGLAYFSLFHLFSELRHYYVLNPENKAHAGKWMNFVIYYQHFSKVLVQILKRLVNFKDSSVKFKNNPK